MRRPYVLTIAGSDPSAGAGLQADLQVFAAWRCRAAAVTAALTAQGGRGVEAVWPVPRGAVAAQLSCLFADGLPDAAKTGMLLTADSVRAVADAWTGPAADVLMVVDPVLESGSGVPLCEPDAKAALVRELLPRAALVTPNAPEAQALTGIVVEDVGGAVEAARALLRLGARAALVKGGHVAGEGVMDVLVEAGAAEPLLLRRPRVVVGRRVHGTGCALSAAIAAALAHGKSLAAACDVAGRYVEAALRGAHEVSAGPLHLRYDVAVEGMP